MLKKILVVDDEPLNLQVIRQILKDRYQLLFATNAEKALRAASQHQPNLILLDVMMPETDGYQVCAQLKANLITQEIPVIFVTAMGNVTNEVKGFDVGAVDYIQKPISRSTLLKRIETHLSLVRAKELENSQREAIYMLGTAGHYNDTDTGLHIWRMAAYACALAEAVGWPEYLVERLKLAAPMHDTGKIGIPDAILKAPRPLTGDEWKIMQQHTCIGFDILSKSHTPIFTMAAEIAMCHHEKWDGSGYPSRLAGTAIVESARIVALADVFDALTVKRPYKPAWRTKDAVAEIRHHSGTHFEPRLVEAFIDILPKLLAIMAEWNEKEASATDL